MKKWIVSKQIAALVESSLDAYQIIIGLGIFAAGIALVFVSGKMADKPVASRWRLIGGLAMLGMIVHLIYLDWEIVGG